VPPLPISTSPAAVGEFAQEEACPRSWPLSESHRTALSVRAAVEFRCFSPSIEPNRPDLRRRFVHKADIFFLTARVTNRASPPSLPIAPLVNGRLPPCRQKWPATVAGFLLYFSVLDATCPIPFGIACGLLSQADAKASSQRHVASRLVFLGRKRG